MALENNHKPYKNFLLLVAVIIIIFGLGFLINKNLYQKEQQSIKELEEKNTQSITKNKVTESTPDKIEGDENIQIPQSFQLTVPFTPQAPTANWDELHNEACEEASSIMTYSYFNKTADLIPSYVETKIAELTKWQDENYGYHLSINTEETARMIEEVYELKTEVAEISENSIKHALLKDKLVILPANGQLLKNPNFKRPGPIYHMLVITGFNEKGFITNDPGTRKGQNYFYPYDTLYNSNGTWSHENEKVDLDNKKIIIISK